MGSILMIIHPIEEQYFRFTLNHIYSLLSLPDKLEYSPADKLFLNGVQGYIWGRNLFHPPDQAYTHSQGVWPLTTKVLATYMYTYV